MLMRLPVPIRTPRIPRIFLSGLAIFAIFSSAALAVDSKRTRGTQTEDEIYIGVKRTTGDETGGGSFGEGKKPPVATNKKGGDSGFDGDAKPPKRDTTRGRGTGDVDDLEVHRRTTGDEVGTGGLGRKPLGASVISKPMNDGPQILKPEGLPPRPGTDGLFKGPKDNGKF